MQEDDAILEATSRLPRTKSSGGKLDTCTHVAVAAWLQEDDGTFSRQGNDFWVGGLRSLCDIGGIVKWFEPQDDGAMTFKLAHNKPLGRFAWKTTAVFPLLVHVKDAKCIVLSASLEDQRRAHLEGRCQTPPRLPKAVVDTYPDFADVKRDCPHKNQQARLIRSHVARLFPEGVQVALVLDSIGLRSTRCVQAATTFIPCLKSPVAVSLARELRRFDRFVTLLKECSMGDALCRAPWKEGTVEVFIGDYTAWFSTYAAMDVGALFRHGHLAHRALVTITASVRGMKHSLRDVHIENIPGYVKIAATRHGYRAHLLHTARYRAMVFFVFETRRTWF